MTDCTGDERPRERIRAVLATLLLLVASTPATAEPLAGDACAAAAAGLDRPAEALVAGAARIVLAELAPGTQAPPAEPAQLSGAALQESEQGDRTRIAAGLYPLDVIEYLKGSGPEVVVTVLPAGADGPRREDFDAHRDARFWSDATVGRTGLDGNCRLVGGFEAGHRYLVFLGRAHVKGYERVDSDDDAWLGWVREQLAGEG